MIDYYETKSQPITRVMVMQAYKKVRANKGSAGIDEMSWADLDKDLEAQLYKLWNRLSSGSYFPMAVKEVEIEKAAGAGVSSADARTAPMAKSAANPTTMAINSVSLIDD